MISHFLGDVLAVIGIVGPTLATLILIEVVDRLKEK
jgi:hypothetical protein